MVTVQLRFPTTSTTTHCKVQFYTFCVCSLRLHRLCHFIELLSRLWLIRPPNTNTATAAIMGDKSQAHTLKCGVPQYLGPKLFTIYMLPTGDIICRHNAQFHLYVDDMQLYITCQHPSEPTAQGDLLNWRHASRKFSSGHH